MILYNVTVNIDASVQEDWLNWMKKVHIPDVLATGLFVENRIMRVLNTEEGEGFTYSVQYTLNSMEDYEAYQRDHAARLQSEHSRRYSNKFVAYRTLLEWV